MVPAEGKLSKFFAANQGVWVRSGGLKPALRPPYARACRLCNEPGQGRPAGARLGTAPAPPKAHASHPRRHRRQKRRPEGGGPALPGGDAGRGGWEIGLL